MKMPLEWHKQCLVNQMRNLQEKEQHLARMVDDVLRNRKMVEFSTSQVREAERRGLDGYDDERLLKPRKPK